MIARRITAALPPFFLLLFLQLLGSVYGPVSGVIAALAGGALAAILARLFGLESDRWWVPVLLASLASLCGIILPLSSGAPRWGMLLFPIVSGSLACMIAFARTGSAPRCAVCEHPLKENSSFDCPRCSQVVCDQKCWVFQYARCRLCDQNKVPIFSPEPGWWEQQLGPRIRQGRCQLCLAGPETADLRLCQQCGRPYCRACWDAANGQCSHCLWTIRDIPAPLKKYVLRYDSPTRASRRMRSGAG